MKIQYLSLILTLTFAACAAGQTPPPTQPAASPAPPPAAPPKRSAADLEKLVAPIALYSDSLIATMLPASVYPLEIVQAARFVADTNNLSKLDAQPWDDNVKAVARVPEVIKQLNDDLSWTMELGDAFLAQDKDVMDAIQNMRGKAQKAGTLQTTPQQIVTVTNTIVEKTVEQKVVVVTNTIVQIQPSSSTVVYVPTYNPYTVYYPPPSYVYSPAAPLVTFGVGMMVGAAIANNNCNWNNGNVYINTGNINTGNINTGNINTGNKNTGNINSGNRSQSTTSSGQQKWQPDQSRMAKSGTPSASASARSAEARGYGSGGAKPSTGSAGARPSTGTAGARPSTGTASASRPTASPSASRSSPSPSASQTRSSPSASRSSSSGSAFGGSSSGASARAFSSRGTSSRSSGGGRGGGGRR